MVDTTNLRALLAAAIPGTWSPCDRYGGVVSDVAGGRWQDHQNVEAYGGYLVCESCMPAEQRLICELRNQAEALLDRLDALEREAARRHLADETNHSQVELAGALAALDAGGGR